MLGAHLLQEELAVPGVRKDLKEEISVGLDKFFGPTQINAFRENPIKKPNGQAVN